MTEKRMSIEEARLIVQTAEEAAIAMPAAKAAAKAFVAALRKAAEAVRDARWSWENASEAEYEVVAAEEKRLMSEGDEAGLVRVRRAWEIRRQRWKAGTTGKGVVKLRQAENIEKEAYKAMQQAYAAVDRLKRVAKNGLGRLECVAESAAKIEREAYLAWKLVDAEWKAKKTAVGEKKVIKAMDAWGTAMDEARKAEEEASSGENKAWRGRLAAARLIVAAADDSVVLKKTARTRPNANTDARRRSKGTPGKK